MIACSEENIPTQKISQSQQIQHRIKQTDSGQDYINNIKDQSTEKYTEKN